MIATWSNNRVWKTSPEWKKLSNETKMQILGKYKEKKNFASNTNKNEKGGEE